MVSTTTIFAATLLNEMDPMIRQEEAVTAYNDFTPLSVVQVQLYNELAEKSAALENPENGCTRTDKRMFRAKQLEILASVRVTLETGASTCVAYERSGIRCQTRLATDQEMNQQRCGLHGSSSPTRWVFARKKEGYTRPRVSAKVGPCLICGIAVAREAPGSGGFQCVVCGRGAHTNCVLAWTDPAYSRDPLTVCACCFTESHDEWQLVAWYNGLKGRVPGANGDPDRGGSGWVIIDGARVWEQSENQDVWQAGPEAFALGLESHEQGGIFLLVREQMDDPERRGEELESPFVSRARRAVLVEDEDPGTRSKTRTPGLLAVPMEDLACGSGAMASLERPPPSTDRERAAHVSEMTSRLPGQATAVGGSAALLDTDIREQQEKLKMLQVAVAEQQQQLNQQPREDGRTI